MNQKPSPITPEDSAALAKKKADAAVVSISRFCARGRDFGVQDFRVRFTAENTYMITLKGRFSGQTAIVEVDVPKDHPLDLYCEQALQEFEQGLAKLAPALPPDVPAALDAAQEQAEAQQRQAQAWVKHGDIRKPAPAGAGKRKPLGLPLCKFCKTQPVQNDASEFCGHSCARDWHVDHARKAVASRRS